MNGLLKNYFTKRLDNHYLSVYNHSIPTRELAGLPFLPAKVFDPELTGEAIKKLVGPNLTLRR
jgi:hypothetical protein